MFKSTQSRNIRRSNCLYGTVGTIPIVAMLVATQPAQAVLLSNASNTVSLCSGVQLPRSDITSALITPLSQIVSPLEATTNGLLSNVNKLAVSPLLNAVGLTSGSTTPLNTDVAGILNQAGTGNLTLSAVSTNGTVLGPSAACYAQANGVTLTSPAGISLGGNSVTGLGDSNQAVAVAGELNSIALGNNATSNAAATGAIAIGTNAAVGNLVPASIDSIAIGRAATVNAANSVALGTTAAVTAANSVALGNASTASRGANANYSAVGVGAGQNSSGEVSVGTTPAAGVTGTTRQITNVAPGSVATDAVNVAQLTGVANTVATLGTNVANGSVGTVRYSNSGTPTVPNGGTVTNDLALVGNGGAVGLHNVAAGTATTDAVNVGQLSATNTSVTNLGTTLTNSINTTNTNIANGSVGLLRYSSAANPTVASGVPSNDVTLIGANAANPVGIHNVAAGAMATDAVNLGQLNGVSNTLSNAVSTVSGNLATLSGLAVTYDGTDHNAITLGGAGGTKLTNLAGGTLSASSTDAVNGSQLNTTNTGLATLGSNVANGAVGIVRYSNAATPTVANGGTASSDVTLVGTGGTVGIHNVTAGTAATDAVDYGQLANVSTSLNSTINTTNLNLASLAGLAVKYTGTDQAAITLGGPSGTKISNVSAGTAATDAANVGQVTTVANAVTNLASSTTSAVTNLTNSVTNGAIGALQYSDAATPTVSNGGHVSSNVTLVGAGGTVGIHNVTGGTLSAASTDAVNGGQLFATNTKVDANTTGLATLGTTVTGQGSQITTNTANIGGLTTNVNANTALLQQQGGAITVNAGAILSLRQDTANGAIGTVQYSNPLSPTTPNGGTPTNDVALVGRDPGVVALHNVANGVVAAGSTDGVNGGQLFALGNQVGTLSGLAVTYNDAAKTSVTLGDGTSPVALTNIQAGTLSAGSTDAVNGSQLFATNAKVDANTTGLATLGTTVAGQGSQISANTANIGGLTTTVNANTTQLQQQGGAITVNAGAILSLRQDTANGAIGTVQYSNPLSPTTPNGGTPTNDVALVGRDPGVVALHNVANGVVAAGSTDGVNGGQLFALGNQVGTLSGLAVTYNDASKTSVTLGNGTAPVSLTNIQAGALSGSSTDAVNGSQLFTTNTNVAANADAIGMLRTDTANGAIGPVQYAFAATPTTPNGGTATNDLTLVGAAAGPVALHNVANGAVTQASTDAVNGSQLFALSNSVGSLSGLAVQYDDGNRTRITLSNPAGTPVSLTGIGAGTLSAASTDAVNGAQLYATDQSVAGLTTQVSDNTTTIGLNRAELASLQTNVSNGAIGTVQSSSTGQPTTPNGGIPSQDLTLVGANVGAVALHNVAAGTLTAGSTDAVNGAQLFATNQSVASLTTSVDNATSAITTLNGTVATNTADIAQTSAALTQLDTAVTNGAIGPVQYSSAANPTTSDGGIPSQDLTLVGAASGAVALHNLAAGSLAAGSTDAINGSQLGALGTATANLFGGNYAYNPTTNSYSGSLSYGGNNYANLQAVIGAIQTNISGGTNPAEDTGIKYFHTSSTLADSSATGADSTAIGPNSASSGDSAIAVGVGASATGDSSVAIGESATAQNGEAVSIGSGNMASGNGAVSIGDPNNATGEGAIAMGKDNTATGDGAIALGNTNSAIGLGAAAIGYINTSTGDGATTIGASNNATGIGAIAIGSNNIVTGDHSLAIGTDVQTTANDTLAIGSHATSSGTSSVTVGNRTLASGLSSVAVGDDTSATGTYTSAFGNEAVATGDYALAAGAMSKATSFASTALGAGASVTGFGSVAVGTGSIASYDGSVALGSASETVRGAVSAYSAFGLSGSQASAGEIAIARNVVYTDPTTGLPTLTGGRQITGVAAGSADTDAVNVSQLRGATASVGSIVAAALGGGSSYNPTTGQLTAPSYTFGTVTYANVGDALQALASTGTGTGTGGGTATGTTVTYTDASQTAVQLAPSGTTVQNVAPGALTAGSTDAVNGSQLAATNTAVATNSSAISTLSTQVSNGAVGVLRYSSSSAPTVANGGTPSNDATLVGADTSAPVALHNVAAGSVAAGSTDAVNGGQLAATNAAVATAQTTADSALTMSSNSLQYDSAAKSAVTLGDSSSGAVTVHNVAPGITATDAANVGQVSAAMSSAVSQANGYTDGRIAQLSFDLKNVQRDAAAGAAGAMALAGMPQPYEAGKGMLSIGAGTFQGQTAIAMGVAKAFGDGHTVVKLGATYNSRGMVGANGGIGYQF